MTKEERIERILEFFRYKLSPTDLNTLKSLLTVEFEDYSHQLKEQIARTVIYNTQFSPDIDWELKNLIRNSKTF